MEFTLKLDKKAQARIDAGRCIDCGECGRICPTGAILEYQKDVSGIFSSEETPMVDSSCSVGCPMGTIPQTVAAFLREGQAGMAYQHIVERNPMPWVSSQVCENLCYEHCKLRNIGEEPIDVRALEKEAVAKGVLPVYAFTKPAYDKIAIIGGGPAGIMAAFELRRMGYRPVIFEKRDRLGGAMSWGIADQRLDKKKLHEEIDRLIDTGVEVRYHYALGENFQMGKIWEEGFAACLLAVGAGIPADRQLRGGDVHGVFEATEILRQCNDGGCSAREAEAAGAGVEALGKTVVIYGNGRLAAETARVLARRAEKVILLAAEELGDTNFPAGTAKAMESLGVEFRRVSGVRQVISDPHGVKALDVLDGSHATNLFCDSLVMATGMRSDVEHICKAETRPEGYIRTDGRFRTNLEKIYACGDVLGECDSVVKALGEGRRAARRIDEDLRRTGDDGEKPPYYRAPAGETIYPENILKARDFRAIGEAGEDCAEDIVTMLRDAGIREDMPVWFVDDGPEEAGKYKKVAVIGGGIAGITAAIALAKAGHRPTIYEKTSRLGGACRWLATNRRFDRKKMDEEMKKVEASGIHVIYNASGGVNPDLLVLMKEYDAILLAIGETAPKKPDIPGADARGALDVISLMTVLNNGEIPADLGQRTAVVGGDEISIDVARALRRLGREVTLLVPCGRGKLQITTGAVDLLLDDGINLVTGVAPEKIQVKNGAVDGVSCRILENGSSLGIPCDTVIFGEGKGPDMTTISLKNLYLDLDEKGYAKINTRLATNMRGVFALGDFNMSSIDAGRAGAAAVRNYLEGTDETVVVETFRPEEIAVEHDRIPGREGTPDGKKPALTLTGEAARCISCGYHQAREKLCLGCGICQRYCPTGAIWMEGLDGAQKEASKGVPGTSGAARTGAGTLSGTGGAPGTGAETAGSSAAGEVRK